SIFSYISVLATVIAYDAYSAYREQRSIYSSRPNLPLFERKPIGYVAGEPMADEENVQAASDAQRKAAEREAKKAEVRKRLEESGNKKNKKKGFLTPERKKKLRKLLMFKAAEDLKRQQKEKEQERQKALSQRTMPLPNVDGVEDKGKLESIYNDLFSRVCTLEGEKFDINQLVFSKETEINELSIAVNDLRGKFVKPTLKKVSKYDNKFKKMAESGKKEDKADFRNNLKTVKKENVLDIISNDKKAKGKAKPEWSKKNKEVKEEETKGEKVEVPVAEETPVEEASEAEEVSEAEASEAE
ncbi:hypothetical protein PFISCL1PPCAC_27452, partial [Pristionchus fissidentatus]